MPIDAYRQDKKWQTVVAISAGNAFEWFDFVIFGYFAVAIAKNFFPANDRTSSLLLSLAAFGVAFVMRPLGAIALGYYADRHGRKPALTLTISLMMIGTALIACAPPHDLIGRVGAYTILIGRMLQGFSAGGEYGSATALLTELEPQSRGLYSSLQFWGQALALVLATSLGAVLSAALGAEQLDTWGWRIPFIFGVLIGPIALYIRRRIPESIEFESAQLSNSPSREILLSFKWKILIACGLVTVATVTVYTLVFIPTFAVQYLGYSLTDAFLISLCTGLVQMMLIPLAGAFSDKWGRLQLASFASAAILATAVPLLSWVAANPDFETLLIFQVWMGAQLAIYLGVLPALMSELFPTRVRTTGLSVSYSFAVATFGGFAPFINAFLIDRTGSYIAPGYYLLTAAVISLASLIALRNARVRQGSSEADNSELF